eukprot:403347605
MMDSPDKAALMFLTQQMRKPLIKKNKPEQIANTQQQQQQSQSNFQSEKQYNNLSNQINKPNIELHTDILDLALKQSFQNTLSKEINTIDNNKPSTDQNDSSSLTPKTDNRDKSLNLNAQLDLNQQFENRGSLHNDQQKSLNISSIRHSKTNSNLTGIGMNGGTGLLNQQDQSTMNMDNNSNSDEFLNLQQQQQMLQQAHRHTFSKNVQIDSQNYKSQSAYGDSAEMQLLEKQMPEVKFQFENHSILDQTPKSLMVTSINQEFQKQENDQVLIKQDQSSLNPHLREKLNAIEQISQQFQSTKNKVQNQKQSQNLDKKKMSQTLTPNKLSKFITNMIDKPAKEGKLPKINQSRSISRSRITSNNQTPQSARAKNMSMTSGKFQSQQNLRSRTPNTQQVLNKLQSQPQLIDQNTLAQNVEGKVDEQFKKQFMQYLEVLKEKVSVMELKVRESQNEKNFYKDKYQEQEEVINNLRNQEKDQHLQFAQLQAQNQNITSKYQKKKDLLRSMQATICSLSISLEQSRREQDYQKKFYSKQLNAKNLTQFESPELIRLNSDSHGSNSKHDFMSRESSVKKIIEDHMTEPSSFSPSKHLEQKSKSSNQFDFKNLLREKLLQLKQNSTLIMAQQTEETQESLGNHLNFNSDLAQIVESDDFNRLTLSNFDSQTLLDHSNRDLIQYLEQNENFGTPNQIYESLEINQDVEEFIKFIVKKLHFEQVNRLKTEEQSAQVIEQLGKTIARLESKPKDGVRSSSRISTPTPKLSNV